MGPTWLICVIFCLQRALSPSRAASSATPKGCPIFDPKSPKPLGNLDPNAVETFVSAVLTRKPPVYPQPRSRNNHKTTLEPTTQPNAMVKSRNYQGKLDGVEFLHGDPALTLSRFTPEAVRLIEGLGLMAYLQTLTNEFNMTLVLQAKRSYNSENCSIHITNPREIFKRFASIPT